MHSIARLPHHNLSIISPNLCLPPPFSVSPPNPILRRDFISSSLLLQLVAPHPLKAETPPNTTTTTTTTNDDTFSTSSSSSSTDPDNPTPTAQTFLDISIDGDPIGRIIIALDGESAPAGAARFRDLVSGAAGVSYRRKEFIKIVPGYVQHGGIRSYGVDAELARKRRGVDLGSDILVDEWEKQNEKCKGTTRNVAKSVGIIVRNPLKPPPKVKLVAREGRLKIDEEEVGIDPNGTEFVIALKDSPELDPSALVVGKVIRGMEVVERIGQVKTVQENSTSPYFRYQLSKGFADLG